MVAFPKRRYRVIFPVVELFRATGMANCEFLNKLKTNTFELLIFEVKTHRSVNIHSKEAIKIVSPIPV